MMAAHSDLLQKFTELAFEEASETRCHESQRTEADNINLHPVNEPDLQNDWIECHRLPRDCWRVGDLKLTRWERRGNEPSGFKAE
jgi:hypothetical protein